MDDSQIKDPACKTDAEALSTYRKQLPEIAENIIADCYDPECFTHVDYEPIPQEGYVVDIINRLREVLFPGYFSREKIDPVTLRYSVGQAAAATFDLLAEQICRSIRHDCFR